MRKKTVRAEILARKKAKSAYGTQGRKQLMSTSGRGQISGRKLVEEENLKGMYAGEGLSKVKGYRENKRKEERELGGS